MAGPMRLGQRFFALLLVLLVLGLVLVLVLALMLRFCGLNRGALAWSGRGVGAMLRPTAVVPAHSDLMRASGYYMEPEYVTRRMRVAQRHYVAVACRYD
jgi:hypothetical protein